MPPPNPPSYAFSVLEQEVQRQRQEEHAARAVASARARLVLGRDAKSAFFATLVLRLVPTADWTLETVATDGRALAYNPAFVCGLSADELLAVQVHEVMHLALAHNCRRGTRDPRRFNVAADLAVNPLLLSAGFVLPAGRLMPGEGRFAHLPAGLAAEEYYRLLSESPEQEQGLEGDDVADPGGCGSVQDAGDGSPSEIAEQAAQWKVAVAQAEQAAKARGELPAGLARSVDDVLHPPTDWREVLREFVRASARNDYSWSRPNRRFVAAGLYLPGLVSEALGEILVAVDTSGSIGPKELAVFGAELEALLGSYDCSATIVYHDARIQKVEDWTPSDGPLVLKPVGGGGTDHRAVFDWMEAEGRHPAVIVCLTDLDTEFPAIPPVAPVLWAVVGANRSSPPFGRVLHITG